MTVALSLIANTRLPSQRAQSLQVMQVASAFARQGAATTLLHARRFPTPDLPPGTDLFDYYAIPEGPRPTIEAVPCVDWIDRVPRRLQFVPARVQELSFARRAARRAEALGGACLSREAESARALVRRGKHDVFLEVHRLPGREPRLGWLREAAQRCAGVIAISEGVAEDLAALGVAADAVRVEHDGFERSRFRAEDSGARARADARRALELDSDEPVVVYTGGLLEWKGVDLLVEAARALPRYRFVIAGGMDADVAKLRALAAGLENVRIDGFQPPSAVVRYLAAGDLGVVPNRSTPAISARYTSPLKIFESFAMGLPLVCSDVPSLRTIVGPGDLAELVPADRADALARGIERLMEDPGRRADLRTRSLARAQEHTWDARAARLLNWMGERS